MPALVQRSGDRLPKELDVLVVGAGPAGAVAAAGLAGHCRVGLVGRAAPRGRIIGESLPSAARIILSDLGLWNEFEAQGHRPAWSRRSIWGGPVAIDRHAILDPHGAGWHLDRSRFDAMLLDAARCCGVPCANPATLRRLEHLAPGDRFRWRCELDTADGPVTLSCRIVVDATGRSARVARHAGAGMSRRSRLACFHVWLEGCSQEHAATTMIEAAPQGWWYSADLPDGTCVIAWHTDSDLEAAKRLRTAADLLEWARGTMLINSRRARNSSSGPLRVAPAHDQWVTEASGQDWLAIGDACLAFDPLASQGLLHSLLTGNEAAQVVRASLDGDPMSLPAWDARVRSIRTAYLANHRAYYALERRWPHEAFWARRQRELA